MCACIYNLRPSFLGTSITFEGENQDARGYAVDGRKVKEMLRFKVSFLVEDGIQEVASFMQRGKQEDISRLMRKALTVPVLKSVLITPGNTDHQPVRTEFLHLPYIGEQEKTKWSLLSAPDGLRLEKIHRFEGLCKEYLGCEHAIALNSCTGALYPTLLANDIGPGDEVYYYTTNVAGYGKHDSRRGNPANLRGCTKGDTQSTTRSNIKDYYC